MSEPTTLSSLETDHICLWGFIILGILLTLTTFLTTRQQIQGLPQVEPAIVQELHCAYGDSVDQQFNDDGTWSATCKEAR